MTAAAAYKSDDTIVIDRDCFEILSERPFNVIRMYRSIVQSDTDPDWKVALAVKAVESLGICSDLVDDCFLLHKDKELLYKGPSETTWRLVKLGILSSITIKPVSIGLGSDTKAASHYGSSNSNGLNDHDDDSSLSMIFEKACVEWDEAILDKENPSAFSPIRLVPMIGSRSLLLPNNDDMFAVPTTGEGFHAGMEQILNEPFKSLDISGEDDFDFTIPTKASDIFPDAL